MTSVRACALVACCVLAAGCGPDGAWAPLAGPSAAKTDYSSEGLRRVDTIRGPISPKSVVHSGNGKFFAQNMMYRHTISVYDRERQLLGTIDDTIDLSEHDPSYPSHRYRGAPVEAAFSQGGQVAWVSNYQMYGPGFDNPGGDRCVADAGHDSSFLYRIDTDSLEITAVVAVGAVPKFVATTADDSRVLVSNWCSYDLSVVDTQSAREVHRVPIGRFPRGIAVDATRDVAYVAVMGSYDIARLDLGDYSVSWLRGVGRSPRHLNLDPAGRYLYASLNGEERVAKIDLDTGQVVARVVTGVKPRSMTLSDDGAWLYVVNYGSATLAKLRTRDMQVVQQVRTDDKPIGVTHDPIKREIWVSCYSGSIAIFADAPADPADSDREATTPVANTAAVRAQPSDS